MFSPLQSLSMTLNFPALFLLSSLADVIYGSEMNREASLGPQEGHSPTGIRPQFCGNRAASFLHAAGLQRTGVQRILAEATKGAALEWKEEKWKKTKKEKKTHIDYPEEKNHHLLPSDSSSAKAARHCFESPHLTIPGTPRLCISGLTHLKPKLQRSLMFLLPDFFFSLSTI